MANKKRVLVVDDNEDTAQIFALFIERLGHLSLAVTRSSSVLEQVRQFKPSIVFLDIHMPHIDGYELARAIRAEFGYDRLKLVAVTGSDEEDSRKRAGTAGFDAHVRKPVDLDIVASILKTIDRE